MAPLIALAIKAIATVGIPEVIKALGGAKAGEAAEKVIEVVQAVTGEPDPAQAVAAIERDPALALELQKRLADEREFFAELELRRETLYVTDTQHARGVHAADRGVFWLGIAVLAAYAIILIMCLVGCGWLLFGGGMKGLDAGTVAAAFGLIGAIIGYIASDAKQVVSYYFGSSRGSHEKSREMADAVKALGSV